jgi:hypothetical protein
VLDTTGLDADDVFRTTVGLVRARLRDQRQ